MISVSHLHKKLSGFSLNDISFTLPDGYIMGLIGENGAGKTTLLRILAGLYTPDSGDISIQCQTSDLGLVFHEQSFHNLLSLEENGRRYGVYYPNYEQDLLLEYLNRFQLNRKTKYKKLSKGEKLKFSLAFAMAHRPKLLLLDEPGANFDREFQVEFHKLLREFTANGENSVILSSHMTSDLEQYADYLLFLRKGSMCLYGDIESVRNEYRMVAGDAYLIKNLGDKIIHMEESELGCKALVFNKRYGFNQKLKVWEPSIEELMYHFIKSPTSMAERSLK